MRIREAEDAVVESWPKEDAAVPQAQAGGNQLDPRTHIKMSLKRPSNQASAAEIKRNKCINGEAKPEQVLPNGGGANDDNDDEFNACLHAIQRDLESDPRC